MTTIVDKLGAIKDCKADIASAIEAKGISVAEASFSDYASLIGQISSSASADRIFQCTVASRDPIDLASVLPFPLVIDGLTFSDGNTVLLMGQPSDSNGLYRYEMTESSGSLRRLDDAIQTQNLVFITSGSFIRHVFSNAADSDRYVDLSIGSSEVTLSSDSGNLLSRKENGLFAALPPPYDKLVTEIVHSHTTIDQVNNPNALFGSAKGVSLQTLRDEYGDDLRVLITDSTWKGIFQIRDPSNWEPVLFEKPRYLYCLPDYGDGLLYCTVGDWGWHPVDGAPLAFSAIDNKPTTLAGYGIIDAASSSALATTTESLLGHMANKDNPHSVTKTQLGLGNVDNTADLDKPLSMAVQTALFGKRNNVIVSSTASATSLEVTGNTVYTFGELSALTITNIEISNDESVIYFTASASGTTISLPAGTPVIDSLNVTAGKKHVLTFMNGIVVLGVCA